MIKLDEAICRQNILEKELEIAKEEARLHNILMILLAV